MSFLEKYLTTSDTTLYFSLNSISSILPDLRVSFVVNKLITLHLFYHFIYNVAFMDVFLSRYRVQSMLMQGRCKMKPAPAEIRKMKMMTMTRVMIKLILRHAIRRDLKLSM